MNDGALSIIGKKRCHYCRKLLDTGQFASSARSKDGLAKDCKSCSPKCKKQNKHYKDTHKMEIKRASQTYRQRMSTRRLAYTQKWRAENPLAMNEWRRRNPRAYLAHQAVQIALERGRLQRPDSCERCHLSKRLHAHHEDYAKPLEVRWLCSTCHRAIHMEGGGDLQDEPPRMERSWGPTYTEGAWV